MRTSNEVDAPEYYEYYEYYEIGDEIPPGFYDYYETLVESGIPALSSPALVITDPREEEQEEGSGLALDVSDDVLDNIIDGVVLKKFQEEVRSLDGGSDTLVNSVPLNNKNIDYDELLETLLGE